MIDELRAEWTKLRTVPGVGWLLSAMIISTVGLSAAAAAAVTCPSAGCGQDLVKISLTGVAVGQALVAMVAVMIIGGEYSTGMIRTTLAAMPRRWAVLGAKAALVAGLVVLTGAVAVAGSLLAARFLLPETGVTAAYGDGLVSYGDASTLRAAAGSVLYLGLVAVLSLGLATAVRDAATAIGLTLGVLYLFPILTQVVPDPDWQRHLERISPMNAGFAIQSTSDLPSLVLGPWTGLMVIAAWASGAMICAALLLQARDA
jgi:ABC-2 type transport system permease protein